MINFKQLIEYHAAKLEFYSLQARNADDTPTKLLFINKGVFHSDAIKLLQNAKEAEDKIYWKEYR